MRTEKCDGLSQDGNYPNLTVGLSGVWGETAIMFRSIPDELKPSSAEFYREKAAEIRGAARAANTPGVAADLLDIAERFERMAAYVERWALASAG